MKNPLWQWKPLGDLFEIGAGKTMSRAAREGSERFPFLRTSNVLWDEIDLSQIDRMALSPAELEQKCVARGDLLVCEGGEIGRAAVWNGDISPMAFQNHLHRLRPRSKDVIPRFYVYFLQSAFTQLGIFEGAENKTTIPNLSRNRLASLEVPHPPTDEQRAIVQVLALSRAAVLGHAQAETCLLELKSAAAKELFTAGIRGEAQKESEIGLVPWSWELTDMQELCEQVTVGVVLRPASHYVPFGVPAFRSLNVREDRLDTSSLVYFDQVANDTILSKSKLQAGDVLIVRTGYPGTSCVVPVEFNGANCIDIVIARPKRELVLPSFVSRFMNSPAGRKQVLQSSYGLAQQHLNVNAVKRTLIPVPKTTPEQREIVDVLEAIDQETDLHRRKRVLFEELYQSLLYKLITGALRASQIDLSVLSSGLGVTS